MRGCNIRVCAKCHCRVGVVNFGWVIYAFVELVIAQYAPLEGEISIIPRKTCTIFIPCDTLAADAINVYSRTIKWDKSCCGKMIVLGGRTAGRQH